MEKINLLLKSLEIEPTKINAIAKFPLIINEIHYLLFKIKTCENFAESNKYFDLLDKIQFALAILFHKYKITLPDGLHQFIVEFDLLYDCDVRKKLFEAIKSDKNIYDLEHNEILKRLITEIDYPQTKRHIVILLPFIYQEIKKIISTINACEEIHEAKNYFDKLQEIQGNLSVLVFKYEIEAPEILWKFVSDFDRLDDQDSRIWLFNQIKNERYSL